MRRLDSAAKNRNILKGRCGDFVLIDGHGYAMAEAPQGTLAVLLWEFSDE
ncbi:hypothetical protein PCI56_18190 [Plesiomonas shigelloides subsp. oncorhynchi]|nr:hypothetical protein [Plesiomonas shigelloides]